MQVGRRVFGLEDGKHTSVLWGVEGLYVDYLKVHLERSTTSITSNLHPQLIIWDAGMPQKTTTTKSCAYYTV